MIYTSYFAKLKSLPDNIIPISICAKAPDWYKGLEYKKLTPSYDLLMHWKIFHDEEYYRKRFKEQVLDKLNPESVSSDLWYLCDNTMQTEPDIVLMCYEKSSNFCHRHLVSDWLNENGIKCEELKGE
ncbi:DUF488 family protein, N3 subclade [Konateibacter massiliensis]|uniref:DUF488 family protein, N3 subclade n=1 Tax=Konateibacter massiliensis TaxID=2002841 RepID=UPI000C14B804|nr:DUF488 family protein [Konateibacter massiliensis]